ncbi:MAG: VanZ family protein [Bacteroidetes bacterium]|nr:MAG: VanZ family protein [Bacteroidota bacterium]TAG86843.1 MAG: VanZ family protein [Bacteroidota bacterium]
MYSNYNLFAFLLAIVMFFLNVYRSQSLPELQMGGWLPFDKFAHFTQFFVFTFVASVGFSKQSKSKTLQYHAIKYSLIISVLFSLILELWQFYFLYPYFQIFDTLANLLGICTGILLFLWIYKKINIFSKKN